MVMAPPGGRGASLQISTHPVEEPPSPPEGERPKGAGGALLPTAGEAGEAGGGQEEAPTMAEDDEPASPRAEESEVPVQVPSEPARRGKLAPEEKLQRKREAQRRYYLKKKAQAEAEGEREGNEVPQQRPEAPKKQSQPKAPRPSPPHGPPPAPPTSPSDEEDAPRPQPRSATEGREVPLDLRLTPHLRSRALLRRDYESRSSRYANLFSSAFGGAPPKGAGC